MLAYHRVGGRSTAQEIDLPADRFEAQMEIVAHGRRRARHRRRARRRCNRRTPAGVDRVVVTFDDGTADFVDVALPILVRHQMPATLYVATEFVDAGATFPDGGTPLVVGRGRATR